MISNDVRGKIYYTRRDLIYICTKYNNLTNFNMNISRDNIKNIVYECIRNQFYNDEDFDNLILDKSFGGENQLIYQELKIDSLDMMEFILNVEREMSFYIGHTFQIDDSIIDSNITLGKIIDFIYNKINGEQ
jgi:acyl carrier protein